MVNSVYGLTNAGGGGEVDTSKIYTLSMASEVLKDVLDGNSSDIYQGAEEAIEVMGTSDSVARLPNSWQYANQDVKTYYQEILTNDHLVTLNTLTNIIGD